MAKRIDVTDLDIYYGDFKAVEGVSLSVEPRSITAFIGPSGCGKSTVLRTLNRMHEVIPGARAEGKVLLDGEDIYASDVDPVNVRKTIGMVFQKPNPFPTMSIYDNVVAGLKLQSRRKKPELDDIVERSLRRANLWEEVSHRLKRPGSSLSGGQQQRLCIARAIAVEPQVLLMDEPCSALDPISTLAIEDLMQELKREYTIVIVTHNMQQAARVSDHTGVLQHRRHRQARPADRDGPDREDLQQPHREGHRGLHHRPLRLATDRGEAQDGVDLGRGHGAVVAGRRDDQLAVQLDLGEDFGVVQAGVRRHHTRLSRDRRAGHGPSGRFGHHPHEAGRPDSAGPALGVHHGPPGGPLPQEGGDPQVVRVGGVGAVRVPAGVGGHQDEVPRVRGALDVQPHPQPVQPLDLPRQRLEQPLGLGRVGRVVEPEQHGVGEHGRHSGRSSDRKVRIPRADRRRPVTVDGVTESGVTERSTLDPGPRLVEADSAISVAVSSVEVAAPVVHSVHLVEHHQFSVAVCDTCGWRSFARRSRPLARDEGRDHEVLHNPR